MAGLRLAWTLNMWVAVAFAIWVVLTATFGRVGLPGRVLIATTSWLAARLAMPALPPVIHWLLARFGI